MKWTHTERNTDISVHWNLENEIQLTARKQSINHGPYVKLTELKRLLFSQNQNHTHTHCMASSGAQVKTTKQVPFLSWPAGKTSQMIFNQVHCQKENNCSLFLCQVIVFHKIKDLKRESTYWRRQGFVSIVKMHSTFVPSLVTPASQLSSKRERFSYNVQQIKKVKYKARNKTKGAEVAFPEYRNQ